MSAFAIEVFAVIGAILIVLAGIRIAFKPPKTVKKLKEKLNKLDEAEEVITVGKEVKRRQEALSKQLTKEDES